MWWCITIASSIWNIKICGKKDRGRSNVAYLKLITKAMSFLHPLLPGECRQHIEKRLLCIKLLLLRTGKKNRIFSLSYSLTHKNTFSVFSSHTHTHTYSWFPSLSKYPAHSHMHGAFAIFLFTLYLSFTLSRAFSFPLTFRWCILCPCVLRASCSDCVGGTKERWVLKQLSLVVRM